MPPVVAEAQRGPCRLRFGVFSSSAVSPEPVSLRGSSAARGMLVQQRTPVDRDSTGRCSVNDRSRRDTPSSRSRHGSGKSGSAESHPGAVRGYRRECRKRDMRSRPYRPRGTTASPSVNGPLPDRTAMTQMRRKRLLGSPKFSLARSAIFIVRATRRSGEAQR
jgi:hypothetical protein